MFVDLQRATSIATGKPYTIAGESMLPRDQFRALVYLDESEAMKWVQQVPRAP